MQRSDCPKVAELAEFATGDLPHGAFAHIADLERLRQNPDELVYRCSNGVRADRRQAARCFLVIAVGDR